MEQTVATLENSNSMMYSSVSPVFIKDVTLMAPGIWTGGDKRATNFTGDEIRKGFNNTDWSNMNLFLDHEDTKKSAVGNWAGYVRNPKMVGDELHGDVEIWHPLIGMFIKQAKANFGVSASMDGIERLTQNEYSDYSINNFKSFSLVDEPGCGLSWLPKALSSDKNTKTITSGVVGEEKIKTLAKVTAMEDERNKRKMSVAEFYAVPRDPPSSSSLPIFDAEHVRNALARFNQTNFDNPSQKKTAWSKIVRAAKKFGIKVSKEDSGKELYNQKEVEIMEENQTQENTEEQKDKETKKDDSEEKAEEKTEEKSNEEVKKLSAKIDKLATVVASISETVKTLAIEKEDPEKESKDEKDETQDESKDSEESTDETSEEESEDKKELNTTKKELEETKKELSALKSEVNSPDRKTLAFPGDTGDVGVDSTNAGMLSFLREKANIPIY